jgi:hypothetical protein
MTHRHDADDEDELPRLLTLTEAARLLRRGPRTLRAWRKELGLKTVRIGRAKFVRREDLLHLIDGE